MMATKERKENQEEDIMTPAMEPVDTAAKELLDLKYGHHKHTWY